jgi:hypothetical protein
VRESYEAFLVVLESDDITSRTNSDWSIFEVNQPVGKPIEHAGGVRVQEVRYAMKHLHWPSITESVQFHVNKAAGTW